MSVSTNLAIIGFIAFVLLGAWLRMKVHLRDACNQHWLAGYARGRQAERAEHKHEEGRP